MHAMPQFNPPVARLQLQVHDLSGLEASGVSIPCVSSCSSNCLCFIDED